MFFLFFSASCLAGGSADSFFQSHDPRARPTASDIWHSSHVTTRFSPLQFVYLPWPLRFILQRVSLPWPDLLQVFAFFGAGPSFFIRSLIYDAGRVLRQRAPYAKIIGCWWITLECAIIKQAPRQTQQRTNWTIKVRIATSIHSFSQSASLISSRSTPIVRVPDVSFNSETGKLARSPTQRWAEIYKKFFILCHRWPWRSS